MEVFTKLLLAHLLADFLCLPSRWSLQIATRKFRTPYVYLHVLLHGLLSLLFLWDASLWWVAVWITASHLLIEVSGRYARPLFRFERGPFLLGQLLHLVALGIASHWVVGDALKHLHLPEVDWSLLVALVFVTHPTAILMGLIMEGMAVKIPTDHKSLPKAGKYIGILERLFVFTFILLGRWDAIGLLITAKSVFRFNDLKESNNRKLTEYILIGTLMSFGFAILAGLAYLYLGKGF